MPHAHVGSEHRDLDDAGAGLPAGGATRRAADGSKSLPAGGSSFFCSGIAPGFTGDAFVLTVASLCQRITSVAVYERIFMGTYSDPLSFQYLGFGRLPEEAADDARPTKVSDAFLSTFSMLADGLGCRFDEVWNHREYAVADADHVVAAGPIPKGTIASVRLCSAGSSTARRGRAPPSSTR